MWAERAVELLVSTGIVREEDAAHSAPVPDTAQRNLVMLVSDRMNAISDIVVRTLQDQEDAVNAALEHLSGWMADRAPVRVLGAGRARLAAAIPANRLAHGGARVYLQDSDMPMPHSLHGGGILAASASGRTPSVLQALEAARAKNRDIAILGVAAHDASRFAASCDTFIGLVKPSPALPSSLSALADLQEYAISELLDSLVVAAGQRLGYTDVTWRLGHEDLGPTGPYDHVRSD